MNSSLNLFKSLHHWASRQDENFTTEGFAYLLKYLQSSEESIFLSILSKLSDGLINPVIDKANQIEISTQNRQENTIQDIQIKTPDKLIFVEVKFGSPITHKQVSSYLELLQKSNYKPQNTKLVCLTRAPISSDITQGAFPLRWYQIAEWLEQELDSTNKEVSQFLIKNFIEFLEFQKATLVRVSSPISEGLVKHLNNAENLILNKRFRNLDKLVLDTNLLPLYNFMMLLFEALKEAVAGKSIKFDSWIKDGGGVTYNINNSEYFVFIRYQRPEVLVFETYDRYIEKKIEIQDFGELVYEYKRWRWKNTINLTGSKFFTMNEQQQINFLNKFILDCINFSERISLPSIK